MDYTPKGIWATIEYCIFIIFMILSIPFVFFYDKVIKPLRNPKER